MLVFSLQEVSGVEIKFVQFCQVLVVSKAPQGFNWKTAQCSFACTVLLWSLVLRCWGQNKGLLKGFYREKLNWLKNMKYIMQPWYNELIVHFFRHLYPSPSFFLNFRSFPNFSLRGWLTQLNSSLFNTSLQENSNYKTNFKIQISKSMVMIKIFKFIISMINYGQQKRYLIIAAMLRKFCHRTIIEYRWFGPLSVFFLVLSHIVHAFLFIPFLQKN